jgi:flagellar basal-body rod protein FlgF
VYTATSGKAAIHLQMQVIANNLANMNTAGFKAERVLFEKSLKEQKFVQGSISEEVRQPSTTDPHEFVKIRGTYTDLAAGGIEPTGNPLDIAIEGEGMFVIQTTQGERYTRSGEFTLDGQNRLITQEGNPVMGSGGEIVIGPGQVEVNHDGSIIVNGKLVGQLRVVQVDKENLVRETSQKFRLAQGGSLIEVTDVNVRGGSLEQSNVNAVKELTDMIFASRLFQALDKVNESQGRMKNARNTVFGRQNV